MKIRYRRFLRELKESPLPTVTCTTCGFLTIADRELTDAQRVMIATPSLAVTPSNLEQLTCSRGLWRDYDLTYSGGDAGLAVEEATKERKCRGYFEYCPGWPPEGHRDLLLRSQDRRHDRLNNTLFTLLGALVALAAQWVAKRLGFP